MLRSQNEWIERDISSRYKDFTAIMLQLSIESSRYDPCIKHISNALHYDFLAIAIPIKDEGIFFLVSFP